MISKKVKIGAMIIAVASLAQAANANGFFDFRTDFHKLNYVSAQVGYAYKKEASSVNTKKQIPVAANINWGQKFRVSSRIFLGYETGFNYLGYSSFTYQGVSMTQNNYAFDALGTLTGFFNPYFELHAKVGPYYGFSSGSAPSANGVNLMAAVGAGLYVNDSTETTLNLNYFNGSNGVGKLQRTTSLNLGINFYF
jgi:hypothetical protein|tara:strand:- start:33332 stop:33916 length:585 start_codon:yes stop_codon:yes gene_type:complete